MPSTALERQSALGQLPPLPSGSVTLLDRVHLAGLYRLDPADAPVATPPVNVRGAITARPIASATIAHRPIATATIAVRPMASATIAKH